MISPELLRRYPFFAGLNKEQIKTLALACEEEEYPANHVFFNIHDTLEQFYLVISGEVGICVEQTSSQGAENDTTCTDEYKTEVISLVNSGEVFAWSSLFSPFAATAGAKTLVPCRIAAFNAKELHEAFETDYAFGYIMMQKLAQVVHFRLRDRRIELLSEMVT